ARVNAEEIKRHGRLFRFLYCATHSRTGLTGISNPETYIFHLVHHHCNRVPLCSCAMFQHVSRWPHVPYSPFLFYARKMPFQHPSMKNRLVLYRNQTCLPDLFWARLYQPFSFPLILLIMVIRTACWIKLAE